MTLVERLKTAVMCDENSYPDRINCVFKALEACKRNNVPIGSRLCHIVVLYNSWCGKDCYSNTSCQVTDEAEIFALVLDNAGIKTERLMEKAPLLASHYETFKRLGTHIDKASLKSLYDFLEPEMEKHLKRYSISKTD